MNAAEYAWAPIGPDAWLLVDGPDTATAGVIRAYLIGIEPDDWLWRGVGGEGRTDTLEGAMYEAQLSVMLAMGSITFVDPEDLDEAEDAEGEDEGRDFIDDLLDPDD